MSNRKVFLNNYIISLNERTRNEKNGLKIGFDWIIYNLAINKNWKPISLPFFRSEDEQNFITKTGAQFGIDMAFYDCDKDELLIFVLKDEKLNNSNWTKEKFDSDIRMASAPDLKSLTEFKIASIRIILAYNKDEDDNGIELFERLVQTLPKKIEPNIHVEYERWNITRIVDEIDNSLITPDLLPQHLTSLLNYVCAQVHDFNYGSEEWEKQLIPNWKNFIKTLLTDSPDDKRIRLIPVSLLIVYEHRKESPDSYAGWIDLIEWAMLAVWDRFAKTEDIKIKDIIITELWYLFYFSELEKYLTTNEKVFHCEHGLHSRKRAGLLSALNDSYLAFWLIGRLGIYNLGVQELLPADPQSRDENFNKLISLNYSRIHNLLKNNPAALRPLIDLHHIELYLIWLIIYQSDRDDTLFSWLSELESRLVVRRLGFNKIPFIEGRNRLDLVAEYSATGEKPDEFVDSSSYMLMMILELTFCLPDDERDLLLNSYHKHIIMGIGDDDKPLSNPPLEINLQSWVPPDDWSKRVFLETVTDGLNISSTNFHPEKESDNQLSLAHRIIKSIEKCEKSYPDKNEIKAPQSAYILACIKNKSPLPPIFWRRTIFPEFFKSEQNPTVTR